ncbi:MAG: non-homologous end-joining DNA ligase [Burkholderiales bacterium]
MLLLRAETLPEGQGWIYELKLDGYRALAIKSEGTVQLRSRNDKDFTGRYPAIVLALDRLPDESVIDGEVVALDASGRPSFNTLQKLTPGGPPVFYYVFDVLVFAGRNLTGKPLDVRRSLLQTKVLPKLSEPIRQAAELHGSLHDLLNGVRAYGFEGLIAKRRDSLYEPGKRSGAWRKMRINRGQEFVIGGYTPSARSFDALIFGYYDGDQLMYVARTRNGFTPRSRLDLFERLRRLEISTCPFANLPEAKSGRWGQGLTTEKMAQCRWLAPALVGQFEFLEWTPDDHLRHSRFVALRTDKNPRDVSRER